MAFEKLSPDDDIIAVDAYVHVQRMSHDRVWMAIESAGRIIHVNLRTARGAHILWGTADESVDPECKASDA